MDVMEKNTSYWYFKASIGIAGMAGIWKKIHIHKRILIT